MEIRALIHHDTALARLWDIECLDLVVCHVGEYFELGLEERREEIREEHGGGLSQTRLIDLK